MREIFESHPVAVLKKEIAKTNIKGYSTMKKAEVVNLMMKNKARFSHIKMAEKKPRAKRGTKSQPSQKPTASGGKDKKKETPKKESDPFASLSKDAPKKKDEKPKGKQPAKVRPRTPDFVREIREEEAEERRKKEQAKQTESKVNKPKKLTKEEQFVRDRRNTKNFQPIYFKRLDSFLEKVFSDRSTGVPAVDKLKKGDPDYTILDKMDAAVLRIKSKRTKGFGGKDAPFSNEDKVKIMRLIDRINERFGVELEKGKRGLKVKK
jgi:type IV secretory pathway VirB10-like protein